MLRNDRSDDAELVDFDIREPQKVAGVGCFRHRIFIRRADRCSSVKRRFADLMWGLAYGQRSLRAYGSRLHHQR